jgi:hypothetical protein
MKPLGNSGNSILEILVAAGIMLTLLMALLAMSDAQMKDLKSFYQKGELTDLRSQIMLAFSNTSVCTWQLANPAINPIIDLSGVTTTQKSSTTLPLNELYFGLDNASSPVAIVGSPLPLSTTGLVVSQITFGEITATGNPAEYIGTLEIQMDSATLVRPLKPVRFRQVVSTTTDGFGVTRIYACNTGCEDNMYDTGSSCVDLAVTAALPAGAPLGGLDVNRLGAVQTCGSLGKRVAQINELVALCAFQGGGPTGGTVGFWLGGGLSSAISCNITMTDTAGTFNQVLCGMDKKPPAQ